MFSVVQWHPFSLFSVAAPLKVVFPKQGSLFFSRVTDQLSARNFGAGSVQVASRAAGSVRGEAGR